MARLRIQQGKQFSASAGSFAEAFCHLTSDGEGEWCGEGELNPHGFPYGSEPYASASSAISARRIVKYTVNNYGCQSDYRDEIKPLSDHELCDWLLDFFGEDVRRYPVLSPGTCGRYEYLGVRLIYFFEEYACRRAVKRYAIYCY